MSDLKPCPFCGKDIELLSSHFEGDWCVHPPVIHCTACHQDYEGVGIAICDAMDDVKKEDFADNLLCKWWNTRPAEDAKDKEIERLKVEVSRYRRALHNLKEDCQKRLHWENSSLEKLFLHEVITHIDAELDYAPDTGKMEG